MAMNSNTVLSMRGITRSYQTGPETLHVLTGVDLEVEQGEWVAIVGASGSGKSTLLNIMGLLDRPDSGIYELGGVPVSTLDDRARTLARNQMIGFVFQQFNLLPRTDAIDDVATPLLYARMPKRERMQRAAHVLESVGLGDRLYHTPTELSGGQIQRVAIARALVTDPTIILADEPTGNLDPHSGVEVLALFESLHSQGATIVMITHDMDIAARADRQLRLIDGGLRTLEMAATAHQAWE
jgi:putative ABC transport system ATP-binding protein